MSDIKIFVSHRIDQESITIDNPLFVNVRCGAVFDKRKDVEMPGDDTGENISQKRMSFCELTVQYWAWKNVKADYFGLCHYRRYLSFSGTKFPTDVCESNNGCVVAPFLDESEVKKFGLTEEAMRPVIEANDLIIMSPIDILKSNSIENNYQAMKNSPDYHNIEDMDAALEIIQEKYPSMYEAATEYMHSHFSRLYNCFVMKNELFQQYSEWLFDILFELEKRIDMSTYSQKKYRTPGTIGERLFGIFCLYLRKQNHYRIREVQLVFFKDTSVCHPLSPAFQENNIAVVSNFNNYYVPIFSSFLISAMEHMSSENNYDFIVLSQDISDDSKATIRKAVAGRGNLSVRYINPKRFMTEEVTFFNNNTCYTEDMYFRLLVPYILGNYTKALVMDVDGILKADIADLYHEDIEHYLAGAVIDTIFQGYLNGTVPGTLEYTQKTLHLTNPYEYCNTGVILMNLEAIRKKYSLKFVLNFINDHQFRIYEQDILNVLLEGNIKFLDRAWNTFTYTNDFIRDCALLAPAESSALYFEARRKPKFIHFAAHPKPWTNAESDFSKEFWETARKSPYYEIIIYRGVSGLIKNRTQNGGAAVPVGKSGLKRFAHKCADKLLPKGTKRRRFVKKIYFKLRGWPIV